MECKAEDHTWDLCWLSPLVIGHGNLHKIVGSYGKFMGGGVVVTPLEGPTPSPSNKQTAGNIYSVVRLVAMEMDPKWEDLAVALVYILEDV